MPKFEACDRIRKRLVTISIISYISLLSVFHRRNENQNTDNRKMYGKIQIVTRHFRRRLHVSDFGVQFLSRNIKSFHFITFLKLECY